MVLTSWNFFNGGKNMLLFIILLMVGFVLLIKGADVFVDGASNIALNLKIPKMIIALTIVAFGTSAPELAVSIKGVLSNASDIVIGNVVGSNILNILLILGISSLFSPMKVKDNTVKKEIPLTILFSTLLMVLCFDNMFEKNINMISRTDGMVIMLFFSIFIYYLFSVMKKGKKEEETAEMSMIKSIIFTIIGLAAIIFGSNLVVDNAVEIAKALSVSEKMISLTIVALGTSLPELVTSVQASRKGENDIAIGNIIGSNIFNIGMVIGIPSTFIGKIIASGFNYIDMFVMVLASIMLFVLTFKERKLDKKQGIIMLFIFVIYYAYVIIGGLK